MKNRRFIYREKRDAGNGINRRHGFTSRETDCATYATIKKKKKKPIIKQTFSKSRSSLGVWFGIFFFNFRTKHFAYKTKKPGKRGGGETRNAVYSIQNPNKLLLWVVAGMLINIQFIRMVLYARIRDYFRLSNRLYAFTTEKEKGKKN